MNREEKWASLPDGPWKDEPNKVQWVDEYSNLDALIVRGPMGALCGYVGVPKDHSAYGKDYDDLETEFDISVHGGLTYAASCQENDPEGICHVPEPGRPADVWWFGFDCSHFMDLTPGMLRYGPGVGNEGVYRDIGYVKAEVTSLAAQIKVIS